MSPHARRLLDAIEHFKERSKGENLPDGTLEAAEKLVGLLKQEPTERETPGGKAARRGDKAADPFKGRTPSGSPGKRAAQGAGFPAG